MWKSWTARGTGTRSNGECAATRHGLDGTPSPPRWPSSPISQSVAPPMRTVAPGSALKLSLPLASMRGASRCCFSLGFSSC